MKCIKYPSIEQFRNIVQNVKLRASYTGKDAEGKAVYDPHATMPKIKFKGTVKLHGTNAGVTYNCETHEFYAQSRENVITPDKDNNGFATFVYANREFFKRLFETIVEKEGISNGFVTVYGEWAGKGIQKGVAVSELPKSFYIFGVKVTPSDEEMSAVWVEHQYIDLTKDETNIFIIEEFGTWEIEVDFNDPSRVQNDLVDITIAVEDMCPVGKFFGVEGVGEGVVWSAELSPGEVIRFKVKGEKHSSSKVKKLATVDIEKLNSIKEFVEYAVTENRLNQGIEQVFITKGETPINTRTGDFIKWVSGDVYKEELDTLVANGLEMKEVAGAISKKAADWYKKYLDTQAFT